MIRYKYSGNLLKGIPREFEEFEDAKESKDAEESDGIDMVYFDVIF